MWEVGRRGQPLNSLTAATEGTISTETGDPERAAGVLHVGVLGGEFVGLRFASHLTIRNKVLILPSPEAQVRESRHRVAWRIGRLPVLVL